MCPTLRRRTKTELNWITQVTRERVTLEALSPVITMFTIVCLVTVVVVVVTDPPVVVVVPAYTTQCKVLIDPPVVVPAYTTQCKVLTDPPVVVPAYTTQCKALTDPPVVCKVWIDPPYNASTVSAITLCPSDTSWYCIKTAEWIRLFLTQRLNSAYLTPCYEGVWSTQHLRSCYSI